MSDKNQPPKPPKPPVPKPPSGKTASVPLKKETVRITLKAKEGEGEDVAPAPTPAPGAPTAPVPAGPPKPGAPPAAKPAPPAGRQTIPLTPAPAAEGAAPVGKQTVQLKTGGPAAQPLPKATVQLQRTQPVSSAPPSGGAVSSARLQTASFEPDEEDEPAGMTAVAVAALVLGAVLLLVMLMGSDKVSVFVQQGGSPSWGIPESKDPFESRKADGTFTSKFDSRLTTIPTYESPN
jgi:hypothetical protein